MARSLTYTCLLPRQSDRYTVFSFCARVSEILAFAEIDRIGRDEKGTIKGFQRPQVASHIREIRQYLGQSDAILPNSVVVAFMKGVELEPIGEGLARLRIELTNGPAGFVVDGQQRLAALSGLPEKEFEVLVSALLCSNEEELRKQFILINNTRPLPKSLIYELLPTVNGLPHRLSSRTTAAAMVERLNYDESSSLRGQIKQHTNPIGVIQDTVLQKLVMNSLADGALRELMREEDGAERGFLLLSNFFQAVQGAFPEAWKDKIPKTSRLVHGAGIIGMGYVMEHLYSTEGAFIPEEFSPGLNLLKGKTAWTEGYWEFGSGTLKSWKDIQFIPRDYMELSDYLVRTVKLGQRERLARRPVESARVPGSH